jgi:polar amino acid transport system substrate-binding protein
MKRLLALPLLALLCFAAPAAARTAAAPEPVASTGSLNFCADVSFPPMEYYAKVGSKTPSGFDVDLANALASSWGVKAKAVPTGFTGLLPALDAKKCDAVISGIFVTPDRTKQFPAVAYMHTHRVFLVQAGNPKHIRGPGDLAGKTAAVQAGTKYFDYLKQQAAKLKAAGKPALKIQTYPGDVDAVGQLIVKRADVVMTQDTSGAYQLTKNPGKFQIAYTFPESDAFGIYVRKSDTAFVSALKQAVAKLKQNGTLAKIAKQHNLPAGDVK